MLRNLLSQQNSYYSNLSEKGKVKFEQRVVTFIGKVNFVGSENFEVTDEMKILIAASAVQSSFGFDDFEFDNLKTINIFPGIFHSKLFNASFKGLTTRSGVMTLSWADLKKGNATKLDKINLGLHEMAHALHIEFVNPRRRNNPFIIPLARWKRGVLGDFYKLKSGNNRFLRAYGGANLFEFFAMCVEHFFEMPEKFNEVLPQLYGHMVLVLNQDPLNSSADYALKSDYTYVLPDTEKKAKYLAIGAGKGEQPTEMLEGETRFQYFLRQKGIRAAMILTVCGFLGIPILFWFASTTVIEVGLLLLIIFMCGAIGLLQWRFVGDYLGLAYHQFAMFAFVGVGINLVNFLFVLNYTININQYSRTLDVTRTSSYFEIAVLNEDASTALDRIISIYAKDNNIDVLSVSKVDITFETGLLGWDKIKECRFY